MVILRRDDPRRTRLIAMLSVGRTQKAIGEALGVSAVEVWRWCQDPSVRREAEEMTRRECERLRNTATAAANDAIKYLHAVVMSEDERTGDRIDAAKELVKIAGIAAPTKTETRSTIEVSSGVSSELAIALLDLPVDRIREIASLPVIDVESSTVAEAPIVEVDAAP